MKLLPEGEDLRADIRAFLRSLKSEFKGSFLTSTGAKLFVKYREDAPAGFFDAEERGLCFLAGYGIRVPRVVDSSATHIALEFIEEVAPSRESAEIFGRELAQLHRGEVSKFGALWKGFIGPIEVKNEDRDSWISFYIDCKLLPLVGLLGKEDEHLRALLEQALSGVSRLFSADEGPHPVHGDLWAGNLLWSREGVYLIDPSAHGGHRELDLSMLRLFGAPYLDVILSSYQEIFPLDPRYKDRYHATTLYYLLVHYVLFGNAYRDPLISTARSILALI